MTNAEVAAILAEMAVLLEFEEANTFRVRAYSRASQAVFAFPRPVESLSPAELEDIPGIGKGIAQHLRDLKLHGSFPELRRLRKKFPPELREMLKIPGLGPKRARYLYEEARIRSTDALRRSAEQGLLSGLPGFGEKTQENLLKGLAFSEKSRRIVYWDARLLADELCAALKTIPGVSAAEAAGSLRRGKETVGDIDIVVSSQRGQAVVDAFTRLPRVERVLAAGKTKASATLLGAVQCDLRVVAPSEYGAALQYFTGSKEHGVALRELALKRGLTLNEYGVFRLSDKKQARPLAGRTEESVYHALGLDYIPPELRENRGEIQAAALRRLPKLVELKDIRGDFHNHSTHTDGRHSLEDMAKAAEALGWEWIALGDHSQSLGIAHGLSVPKLRQTFHELDGIRAKVDIELMRSMEVDILQHGELDYSDEVLEEIDVVIGSVHSRFKQPGEEMTGRLKKALQTTRVDILGHPSGRRLNIRPPYDYDFDAVAKAAAESHTALEVNGQPERQDLDDLHARRAKELGAPLALDTDAHSTHELNHMKLAVTIARRAWLEPKDIINCMGKDELKDWLEERRRKD